MISEHNLFFWTIHEKEVIIIGIGMLRSDIQNYKGASYFNDIETQLNFLNNSQRESKYHYRESSIWADLGDILLSWMYLVFINQEKKLKWIQPTLCPFPFCF